uniref:Transmembrane protein n=1 Tax=Globodera pallida TaxID=36090 RepID=A0A183BUG9_GLOPA
MVAALQEDDGWQLDFEHFRRGLCRCFRLSDLAVFFFFFPRCGLRAFFIIAYDDDVPFCVLAPPANSGHRLSHARCPTASSALSVRHRLHVSALRLPLSTFSLFVVPELEKVLFCGGGSI